jgi:hypothetical protein
LPLPSHRFRVKNWFWSFSSCCARGLLFFKFFYVILQAQPFLRCNLLLYGTHLARINIQLFLEVERLVICLSWSAIQWLSGFSWGLMFTRFRKNDSNLPRGKLQNGSGHAYANPNQQALSCDVHVGMYSAMVP